MSFYYSVLFLVNFFHKTNAFFVLEWNYSRTPGSRQPSPAEEAVTRPQTLLDPNAFHQQHFQHMLNASMDHHNHGGQLNSFHPPLMNHQMQGQVMNGVGGLQVPQVNWVSISINISIGKIKNIKKWDSYIVAVVSQFLFFTFSDCARNINAFFICFVISRI